MAQPQVTQLWPGAVKLSNVYTDQQLADALQAVWARGETLHQQGAVATGWYTDATGTTLNHGQPNRNGVPTRGRVYDSINSYDAIPAQGAALRYLAQRALEVANAHDVTIPTTAPTHLLAVRYDGKRGIDGHLDGRPDNGNHIDGNNLNAIVTVCLGNTATFKSCDREWTRWLGRKQDDFGVRCDTVQHGDVIVWGGPHGRWLWHGVSGVQPNTAPPAVRQMMLDRYGPVSARVSLTFRVTPEHLGQEGGAMFQMPHMG